MDTPTALMLITASLFSEIESKFGFAGPDAPRPDRETDPYDIAAMGGRGAGRTGLMPAEPAEPARVPWQAEEAIREHREPRMAGYAGLGAVAPGAPQRGREQQVSGLDYPYMTGLRRQAIVNAQRLTDLYNRYAEKEYRMRGRERQGIRTQIFAALRSASSDYGRARTELAMTFAQQQARGLSPLDLGARSRR